MTITKAKRRFLEYILAGPTERPSGCGGAAAWDHNVTRFAPLIEVYRGDGRVIATLTTEGEIAARQILADHPVRARGRPPAQFATYHQLGPRGQAILRERWAQGKI